jgi:hypothetical protein
MSDVDHGIAATVGGAIVGAAMVVRRMFTRDPETPEGFARRLADAEREIASLKTGRADDDARLLKMEARMQSTETMLAGAFGKLTESTDRQWKAIEKLTESVDDLRGAVTRVDVEATIERELRKHARKES